MSSSITLDIWTTVLCSRLLIVIFSWITQTDVTINDFSVFLGMRSWKNLAYKHPYLRVPDYLKACSVSLPRAQSSSLLISILHSFQRVLKVSSYSDSWINPVEMVGKCQFPVGRVPSWSWIWPRFGGHFMTISSHCARNAHSQFWKWFHWQATQCIVTRLDLINSN